MATLGVCGDNCGECPRGIATKTGDPDILEKALSLWIKTGQRTAGTPAISLYCAGCASAGQCAYDNQRECAVSKGLDNCGLCGDYPCAMVNESFKRSDDFAAKCRKICSKDDFEQLEKAFFMKRKYLDEQHGIQIGNYSS
ncbi:MAG TPA: DUF3795 domain-containing protein [Chitinivibrionales bacterium]|nr:DUF3795 domain-containing protein [Chitinivibrionales bacterium]